MLIGRTSGSALRVGVWDGTGRGWRRSVGYPGMSTSQYVLPCPANKHPLPSPCIECGGLQVLVARNPTARWHGVETYHDANTWEPRSLGS